MKIWVKYFASYRALTGLSAEKVQLPEGSSVEGLIKKVKSLHEPLRKVEHLLVAVNMEFVDSRTILREGNTAAFFPSVSGG